jgi:hypothetical protein
MKKIGFVAGALGVLLAGCGGVEFEQDPGALEQTPVVDAMEEPGQVEQGATVDDCTCSPMATSNLVYMSELTALQSDCNATSMGNTIGVPRACIAATHRWCANRGFSGGVPSEFGPNNSYLEVDCYKAARFDNVSYGTLAAQSTGCSSVSAATAGTEFSKACSSAANRFCHTQGYASGAVQEINSVGLRVSCINRPYPYGYYTGVTFGALGCLQSSYQAAGDVDKGCRSKINQWCQARGAQGGLPVEVAPDWSLHVFCMFQ